MLNRINAIVLPVKDVKGCALFYRDKLGFSLPDLQEEEAYLTLGAEGAPVLALKSLGLSAREISEERIRPNENPAKRTQLVVFVPDLAAEKAALETKGVNFVDEPSDKGGGWITVHFEDPEGNLWELAQKPKK